MLRIVFIVFIKNRFCFIFIELNYLLGKLGILTIDNFKIYFKIMLEFVFGKDCIYMFFL